MLVTLQIEVHSDMSCIFPRLEEAFAMALVEDVPPTMAELGLFLTMLVGYVALAVPVFVWISQIKMTCKHEFRKEDGTELV
jgi:large-conductance mechanosensitive channel